MLFSQSLKENRAFRRLYSRGRHTGARCVVLYCRGNSSGTNRLGVTVSVKLGNAVCRNRIRRRLKEIYRTNESRFKRGYDIIAVARHSAVGASYTELRDEFLRLASELGLTV